MGDADDLRAPSSAPLVVGIEMGYGHRRPAAALAEALGVRPHDCDRAPLSDAGDDATYRRVRRLYEGLTRGSTARLGAPLGLVLDRLTAIPPLHPPRDLSKPDFVTRRLARKVAGGFGAGLVEVLRASGRPLLTTYFGPAHVADAAGLPEIHCVVTDSEVHRVWAPLEPARSRIRYYVPSQRARDRLRAYGVPAERVSFTGYPLPPALLGGPDLATARRHLAARLVRLDPGGRFRRDHAALVEADLGVGLEDVADAPPTIAFAIGGAGAQTGLVPRFLPSLAPEIRGGRLRLALVAGIRPEVARRLTRTVYRAGLGDHVDRGVEILFHEDVAAYFVAFDRLMARTDVLWTKPSELTFFGALGLPIVFAPPVGMHEALNRRWAIERGAGLEQGAPRQARHWLRSWLEEGILARAAWTASRSLPARGLYTIVDALRRSS